MHRLQQQLLCANVQIGCTKCSALPGNSRKTASRSQFKNAVARCFTRFAIASIGDASLLLRSRLNDAASNIAIDRRTVEVMVQSCSRQLQLIESLTATQQFDVKSASLAMKPLSLPTLVQNILIERLPILNQHRVKVKQLFAADLPLVNADAQQLWRVFGNLIDNAVKYNQSGFILTVEAKKGR